MIMAKTAAMNFVLIHCDVRAPITGPPAQPKIAFETHVGGGIFWFARLARSWMAEAGKELSAPLAHQATAATAMAATTGSARGAGPINSY